ncbi:hypothetical protein R1flu_002542 [Riccia fluitans]|uniref:ATP synthase protein MI25 n=1 Tax=Riccia fluitans TaxID=41844 RepID=A0ABD1Y9S1_9MARC
MAELVASWSSNLLYGGCVNGTNLSLHRAGCSDTTLGPWCSSDTAQNFRRSWCRRARMVLLSSLGGQNSLRWQKPDRRKRFPSRMTVKAFSDPELHFVLQLASDAELQELSNILYGRSLLSPLVKSFAAAERSGKHDQEEFLSEEDERNAFMSQLESRFLFLAADAKSTLSGRRPTYRNVLLQVRKKLNVPCPCELSTEDLESEIFLCLLQQSSRKSIVSASASQEPLSALSVGGERSAEEETWRSFLPAIMKLRGKDMLSAILKGGGAVTVSTLQRMVFKRLSKKLLLETAKYQLAKEAVVKTGQAAAVLEARVAVLAAQQGLMGAAKRYLTVRGALSVLGPVLWGTLVAEMLINSVGTDYARIIRAICTFAQIRLMRTHHSEDLDDFF